MKVLIVNPILYTSETQNIKRVKSVKDTMIYDLCLAFKARGHDVTLVAGEPYRPTAGEEYPFKIAWAKCILTKICRPNVLPLCPEVRRIAKNGGFDMIISSEVFSLNSFVLATDRKLRGKTVIWHELADHNNLMHKIPSKIWYGIVARLFFGKVFVVARSEAARVFISKYCSNVCPDIIDHGVNTEKFVPRTDKENYFIIPSQLIARKQVDRSIRAFADFARNRDFKLYVCGEGEEEENLRRLVKSLGVDDKVTFFGKVTHDRLSVMLAGAAAMLIYTRKDLNMVSIVESIACATPVVTTSVPYSAAYIRKNDLGIVSDNWDSDDLCKIVQNNSKYVNNCLAYRERVTFDGKADEFIRLFKGTK